MVGVDCHGLGLGNIIDAVGKNGTAASCYGMCIEGTGGGEGTVVGDKWGQVGIRWKGMLLWLRLSSPAAVGTDGLLDDYGSAVKVGGKDDKKGAKNGVCVIRIPCRDLANTSANRQQLQGAKFGSYSWQLLLGHSKCTTYCWYYV